MRSRRNQGQAAGERCSQVLKSVGEVGDPSLLFAEAQAQVGQNLFGKSERRFSPRLTLAQHHEVVGKADQLLSGGKHPIIERVEIKISQQRRDRRALRQTLFQLRKMMAIVNARGNRLSN